MTSLTTRPTVGASDVPVILGLAPWADASPVKLWAELSGLIPYRDGTDDTPAKQMGRRLETTVLGMYADHAGVYVQPEQERYQAAHDWMHATPDAWSCTLEALEWMKENGGTDPIGMRNVEAKVALRDGVWEIEPAYYTAQVMWQNVCTARNGGSLAVLFLLPFKFRVYEVPRDYLLERALIAKVWSWYDRHVNGGVVPEMDDSKAAARTLARVHRNLTGSKAAIADWRDIQRVQRVRDIREEMGRLESEKQKLTNELRAVTAAASATVLRHPGGKDLARWSNNGAFTVTKEIRK